MADKNKDETMKRDRFKIWIYVGFTILGILLLLVIIGLFYYLFSSNKNTPLPRNNTISNSTIITKTSSSLPIMTTQDRSKYMSSIFRYGGFGNRLKRY